MHPLLQRSYEHQLEPWTDEVFFVHSDLNALVANYLFTEGYLDAASHFAREASLDPTKTSTDLESIQARRDIRSCVQRGKIQEALDKVVELDPEVSFHFPCIFSRISARDRRREENTSKIDYVLCTTLSFVASLAIG